jgi:hypothetical protein
VRDRWSAWLTGEQSEDEVRTGCKELASYIAQQREKLSPEFDYLKPPSGINGGSQPLVLWKNRQLANHRRTCRVDGFTDNENSSVLSESLRKEYSALTASMSRKEDDRISTRKRLLAKVKVDSSVQAFIA